MRIPNDALPPYHGEIAKRGVAETNQSKPVDGLANLRAALPNDLPPQRQARPEDDSPPEENPELGGQNENRRLNRGQQESEERRKEERRKEQRPILLDTRLSRSRRESAREAAIDLKV